MTSQTLAAAADDDDEDEFVDARETLSQRSASFSSQSDAYVSATEGDAHEVGTRPNRIAYSSYSCDVSVR